MHHHYNPPTTQKRDTMRPINTCPPPYTGWILVYSRCLRSFTAPIPNQPQTPQAYKIHCITSIPPPYAQDIYASCLPTEICIDSDPAPIQPYDNFPVTVARCISTDNYRKIASVLAGQEFGSVQIPANNRNNGGGQQQQNSMADAVLTGPTITTSVQAQSMELRALTQLPGVVHNVPHFAAVPNGTWDCNDCFNIGPQLLPGTTDALVASVTLDASVGPALLYLTTFS